MEEAVEQLKREGYTSEQIKAALEKMKTETMEQETITGSLSEYLDTYIDENAEN